MERTYEVVMRVTVETEEGSSSPDKEELLDAFADCIVVDLDGDSNQIGDNSRVTAVDVNWETAKLVGSDK